jgi:hypothetical protein
MGATAGHDLVRDTLERLLRAPRGSVAGSEAPSLGTLGRGDADRLPGRIRPRLGATWGAHGDEDRAEEQERGAADEAACEAVKEGGLSMQNELMPPGKVNVC